MWIGWCDGHHCIGHRSSKSTFGANKWPRTPLVPLPLIYWFAVTDDIRFGPTDDTFGGNGLFCKIGSNRPVSKKDPKELDLKTGPIKYFCRHLDQQLNMGLGDPSPCKAVIHPRGPKGNKTQCIDSIFCNQWAPLVLLQYWVDWDIYCKSWQDHQN